MKFSEKTITDFMSRGDFTSVVRVFRSLQREVDLKDELIGEYIRDMSNLMTAFKALEEQKDGLKRQNAAFKNLCTENGLGERIKAVVRMIGSPAEEQLEELMAVEDTGEPEELQPE